MKYGDVLRDLKQPGEKTLVVMFVAVVEEQKNGADHAFIILDNDRAFMNSDIRVWTADDWEPVE